MDTGVETMQRHEASWWRMHSNDCGRCPGSGSMASQSSGPSDRVGVIPFNLDGVPHALVAAILATREGSAYRMAASARSRRWRGCSESPAVKRPPAPRSLIADQSERPGMVRISLGAYNSPRTSTPLSRRWSESPKAGITGPIGRCRRAETTCLTHRTACWTSRCGTAKLWFLSAADRQF